MPNDNNTVVSSDAFYGEYHGHKVSHLEKLLPSLRRSSEALIWTAGDSSLDNKYWFNDTASAVGAYREILQPPRSIQDVTHWLNAISAERCPSSEAGVPYAAINTAVEATTVNERTFRLRPQDRFLRDNISKEDVLVVSIGGNDVAMLPMPCTVLSMLGLLMLPTSCVEHGCICGTAPCDDCCCGCGASTLSCACAYPCCMGYFAHLFGTRVEHYIKALTSKTKPKRVLVCMIYYPDENQSPSWAGAALGALGYNRNPAKLQTFIRKTYEKATSKIRIPGTEVVPVPLFNALDGKRSSQYVDRVEPSAQGGRVMAEYILDLIDTKASHSGVLLEPCRAPTTSYMENRS